MEEAVDDLNPLSEVPQEVPSSERKRGMDPLLLLVNKMDRLLSGLSPVQQQWALDYLNGKYLVPSQERQRCNLPRL